MPDDEYWNRLQPFMRDGVEIHIMAFAYTDYAASTTVFTSKTNSEIFHADKHCHRLHQSESYTIDGTERRTIHAHPLEKVMTTWLDPVKPCDYCTQNIETTAEIATEIDGVPEELLKYFEPGDKRVTRRVNRNDDGTVDVTETATEVY